MKIRKLETTDYPAVSNIYLEGIATGQATFELSAPCWEDWDKNHCKHSRIVLVLENRVAGWAAVTPVSSRCVYAGVGEVSIYIGSQFRGQGLGKILLSALIEETEANGIWTLQAGIFPENISSISLHEKLGFRQIGHREKIGQMNGTWRDTVLMERRSRKVGV